MTTYYFMIKNLSTNERFQRIADESHVDSLVHFFTKSKRFKIAAVSVVERYDVDYSNVF